ncbi:hypothetical protein WN984_20625 [Streptomyces noursei]|nr:hypothetical protein [Streptomyces noursei]
MAYAQTPVELPLTLASAADPGPVPGCDICAALAKERALARSRGDHSKVSDCNVEIRNHPHKELKQRGQR